MYDFSLLWFMANFYVCCFVICLVVLSIDIYKKRPFSFKKHKTGILLLIALAFIASEQTYVALFPDIDTYTGEMCGVSTYGDLRPPDTVYYTFWNGEGKKKEFNIRYSELENFIPEGLQEGVEYTVYYETHTKIIVKIEYAGQKA